MSNDSGPGASSGANNNSLIAQFERAYAETMVSLTQESAMHDKTPETVKEDIDAKITQFTDLARQMETFFLQKQLLLYAHKPELHLKDESTELRQEIARKDELIRKHNERLAQWLKMLQDLQQQQRSTVGPNAPMASPNSTVQPNKGPPTPGNFGQQNRIPGSPSTGVPPTSSSAGPLQFLEKTTTSIGGGMPPR